MSAIPVPQPPEPLTRHEQSIVLIKSAPPEPRWAFYLFAMLTSLGGFILGWVYFVKEGAANKRFGLTAFILGFVVPLVVVAIIVWLQLRQVGVQAPLPPQPGELFPN